MNKGIHGGDIYRNKVCYDFSVNINPLGVPDHVKQALAEAINHVSQYPDIEYLELKNAIAKKYKILPDYLVCGNGASEIFLALIRALKPNKILIPVPSFYGYEKASMCHSAEIIYYEMKSENEFSIDKKFLNKKFLNEIYHADVLFLANPNNPTGKKIPQDLLHEILERAKNAHTDVILDECFLEFMEGGQDESMIYDLETYQNLYVVRAFTKIFAIPGVRLGYLCTSNERVRTLIMQELPEWNLSIFAQMSGVAACQEMDYLAETVKVVDRERNYLTEELKKLGIKVYLSNANFIMIESETDLYQKLLEHQILIRDCSNYRGLKKNYYRVAVKMREQNEKLIQAIREIVAQINCYTDRLTEDL